MGGRGASSSQGGKTRIISYQDMLVNNQDVPTTLVFNKKVDIIETRGIYESMRTLPYNKVDYSKINEAIVQVDYGSYERKLKELESRGYKIIERTDTKNKKVYDTILLHIKKK